MTVSLKGYTTANGALEVINQYGQVMDRVVLQDQNEQAVRVEVRHYAAGAYYVRVDNGEAVPMVKKFEKVR